jgi:outer membrane protein OmpA-like peptidoglycan-associated protein
MALRARILEDISMKSGGIRIFFTAAAALLLILSARPANTAFGESYGGVELEADVVMTSDPAAAPVAFLVKDASDPFADPAEGLDGVAAWQIQVFDRTGRKAGFLQGKGRPPAGGVIWNGISSGAEPLPDGFYKAKFAWLGRDKKPRATPEIMVSLSTPLELHRLAAARLRLEYTPEGLAVTFPESVIFKPGESRIKAEGLPALQELSEFLKGASRNKILVRGHSDDSGSLRLNLALSGERAARVCRFLSENGIEVGRMSYTGLGPSKPVASNKTETGRARNRRVEVLVLRREGEEPLLTI